jgi:hypothetical protein
MRSSSSCARECRNELTPSAAARTASSTPAASVIQGTTAAGPVAASSGTNMSNRCPASVNELRAASARSWAAAGPPAAAIWTVGVSEAASRSLWYGTKTITYPSRRISRMRFGAGATR